MHKLPMMEHAKRDFTVVPPHPLTDLAVAIDRMQRRANSPYLTDTDKMLVRESLPVLRALLETLTQAPEAWADKELLNRYRDAVLADRIAAALFVEKKEAE